MLDRFGYKPTALRFLGPKPGQIFSDGEATNQPGNPTLAHSDQWQYIYFLGIRKLSGKCSQWANIIKDVREVQKNKSAPVRPKTFIFISWITYIRLVIFVTLIIFGDTRIPNEIGKIFETCSTHIIFIDLIMLKTQVCQFSKSWAPGNDENPLNNISKIMDMRSISIKSMKWKFGNM